jgi:serine/threonine-protein kinase
MVVGTPHYSQPEQLKTRVLTPASDVYSLGMILYELLTARSPFHAGRSLNEVREEYREKPLAWLRAHANSPLVPLGRVPGCEDLPRLLIDGVHAALDKNPKNRPPDAGAFANILGVVLHRDLGIPVAATLKLQDPKGEVEDRLFLPGSYRIGSGKRCEIRLVDEAGTIRRVHAVLEWSGIPSRPYLRPIVGDGSLRINDRPVRKPVELAPNDAVHLAGYQLAIVDG